MGKRMLGMLNCILALAVGLLPAVGAAESGVVQTIVEATCTEPGYILTTDHAAGTTQVENLPATGHDFGDWIPDDGADTRSRMCSVCGFSETLRNSTVSMEKMPRLFLTGSMEGINKKNKVALEAEYSGPDQSFSCYAIMTLQGHSTYGCPKHNYTVRFYDDDQSVAKHKLRFRNWKKEHKYILKANYYDLSQCRNLVAARIWSDMAACRDNLSPRIAALPCYGAVDGFPVEVYLNGEYFGLYTMNLHKDDDLYGMKEGERSALVICNYETTDESLFRAPAVFAPDYSSDWEIEFSGTGDEAWVRDSFNDLIDFVMNSPDKEFRKQLGKRLDVDAAIDYLIFIYALGLPNSGAKDLVMLNYGGAWIPSAYDMDEAFGLNPDAASYLTPGEFLPQKRGDAWVSGTGSLLWDRLLNLFGDELRERYAELRRDVLSEERITALVEEFTGNIPEPCYDMDLNLYPDRPIADPDMKTQICDYISPRFGMLDLILEVDAA